MFFQRMETDKKDTSINLLNTIHVLSEKVDTTFTLNIGTP